MNFKIGRRLEHAFSVRTWVNRVVKRKMHDYTDPCDAGCGCGTVYCSICEPMVFGCSVTDKELYERLCREQYGEDCFDDKAVT